MALPRFIARYEAGDAWLAGCSARPDLVRAAWDTESLAPIASGAHWLVAEGQLATRYDALARIPIQLRGPVLADPEADRLWWLVPLTAVEELADVRQVAVRPPGWCLRCPPAGWQIGGRMWITRPDGSGLLTDPAVLAAAFGPGGYRVEAI
ncbi:hypothetical protein SZN_09151 [Streptomyces zinciresistens K42]|uniref:Uncharacterized protein n=1 Tax=Streptomyces zinciresistens K42 TaxID=700597 RepID=G2G8L2_9ACTN|nr:hypothetical protein [Streptomyces zinciresistens]EGX60077.1 hypothetical protein SZN_09151 [Streptomyces zinciresistens K42]